MKSVAKVLIVDDDKDIAEVISLVLKKEQIDSSIINDSSKALEVISSKNFDYDLILLDIMMPGLSGTEVCSRVRDIVNIPIIFVSAKSEMVDKIVGYEIGGDDYITKPFDNTELVLKVKSHLRLNKRSNLRNVGNIIKIGEISLNTESFEVKKNDKRVDLSTREFELLRYLMENAGIALSKEQIFENVWGSEYGDIGTVAVNIKSVRDKLEDNDKYILTIWGYGYKFVRVIDDETNIWSSVIKRKFLILISIIVLINACSLALWYNVRIKPTFIHNDYIRREIETKEIKKEYESIEKLELELKRISKKYETRFSVLDDNQKTVVEVYVKNTDFFLFSDVVKVDDEMFIITAYLHRDFSVASMVLSMIFFQIFVIFVLMTSTFYATGKTIINPIQRIVNDIRAYKFGKKPVRNEVSTELDIIQNEFVNLVDSLEEEKREQNRIIASISHDIKTPLTSIISYSYLLDDDSLSREEIVKYSVKINEKAHHIKNILGTFDEYLTSYDNKKLKLDDILVKDIVSDLITDYKVE